MSALLLPLVFQIKGRLLEQSDFMRIEASVFTIAALTELGLLTGFSTEKAIHMIKSD